LPRQAERQIAILRAALRAVRKGGRVLYSTCSLEPEENEAVAAEILSKQQNVRVRSMEERINTMALEGILAADTTEQLKACITPEGYLRLLPGDFDTDGFFIALLEKS
jgi:16S rRNA (cytosine967-C5)-methyltransferase